MNIFEAIDIIVRRPELETVFEEPLASDVGWIRKEDGDRILAEDGSPLKKA